MHAETTQTIVTRARRNAPIGITRVTSNLRNSGLTDPYEREPSYLAVLQLRPFGEQDLWVGGRPAPHLPYAAGSLMIYDLERNWVSNLIGEYDCIQFYIPERTLLETAADMDLRPVRRLHLPPHLSVVDPVVHHIGQALLPALAHPERASKLFVESLTLALHAHLVHTYSGEPVPTVKAAQGGLAPWQERRAKELIQQNLDGEVTLEWLARECGVSRSHFAKAFRASTGMPPHQWLVVQRVDRAKHYLKTSTLMLGQIALICGFADQSHFTRTFSRLVGVSPGHWRKMQH